MEILLPLGWVRVFYKVSLWFLPTPRQISMSQGSGMWNFWVKDPTHILSGSWAFSRGWAVAEVFSWYLNMSWAGARVIGAWHLRLQPEDRISVFEQSTRPMSIDISTNQEESACRSLNIRFSFNVMNFHRLSWIVLSIFCLSFGPFPALCSDFKIISHKFSWEGSHWRSCCCQ